MHLRTLRMRGFKSFAQSVELHFEHGIAVVVGPNGSGKSNIADALQWAMAVQSPGQLRAPTGQDVLFSGTDSRPAAGVCEVELVLDNECSTLPIEFSEVSVMRRLYRDGESEYFINRARVRRLDVLELLSDTGLGREMHSVIGQGRVEEILLAKPYERRRFVEEAAGLGKYQRRRTRAEAKLVRVAAELERARDLEREVRARLRPLAMQATAAERAAKLGGEIAAGRVALLSSELVGERARVAELSLRLGEARAARGTVDEELQGLAGRRQTAEHELTGLASAQERAARAFYAFETARDRLDGRRGRLEGAIGMLERAALRRGEDVAELRRGAERLTAEAAVSQRAAAEHREELAALEATDTRGADKAAGAAEAALAAALDARRAHAEAEGQAANVRRELEAAATRVTDLGARLELLAAEAGPAGEQLEVAATELARLTTRHADGHAAFATAAATADQALADAAQAQAEARAAGSALDAARDAAQRAHARLETLELALQRGEGLSPAAQALRDGGARLVLSGVEAEPGYERAVAAALGWRAGAVVADRLDEAVELLAGAEGELTVLVASERPAAKPGKAPAGGRPLVEVLRSHDPALAWLVQGVWLVDDLRSVTSGVGVTVDGAGYDADRGEMWRTADAGEAAWLAARSERDQLARRAAELDGEVTALAAAAEAASARAAELTAAEEVARGAATAARDLERELAEALREAQLGHDRLADERARSDAQRDLAARDLEAENARLAELRALSAGFEAALVERRDAATQADERHAGLELTRRRLADEAARHAARVAALSERIERFGQDAARAEGGAQRASAQADAIEAAIAQGGQAAPQARLVVEAMLRVTETAQGLAAPAREGIAAIEQRAAALAEELRLCAEAEAEAQGRGRELSSALTEVEVSMARSGERIDDLERRRAQLVAEHGIELSEPEQSMEPDAAAATAARLERLERRRESLGAVNPLAQEEYEQEKVRADDLSTQCDDLDRSLTEVRALIRDLTRTIDQRFATTFDSVAANFAEVVQTLFPGGRGRLRLTQEPEPVEPAEGEEGETEPARAEPGIDLEVRPAGKRIESLSLLSGGEKSLTAIAFLFALLLTKPSPFYLLDEVEAALDDANIDRFLDLLRAYQDKAQFVVITHQRRTMEVADVLYGVTMAGDGESQVLSRRMPSDPALHEAALETA